MTKNKILIDINRDKMGVTEFEYYAKIISDAYYFKRFRLEIKTPKDGFKVVGDLSLMSENAHNVYKYLIKREALNNIYLIKKEPV